MKLNKRTLTLGVAATMVGGVVSLASVSPAGAAQIADNCGTYIQGFIDPVGGLIPAGALGNVNTNTPGQTTYIARGHESKGGDKVINTLENTALGGVRFSASLTIGGLNGTLPDASGAPLTDVAPVLSEPDPLPDGPDIAGGTTSVKVGWKNDKNIANRPLHPTVQVGEKAGLSKAVIAKGAVTGVTGADNKGPAIGNVSQTAPVTNYLTTPKGATSGTYKLRMEFPSFAPPPFTGATIDTTLDYNDDDTQIASALSAAFAPFVGPGAFSVAGAPDWSAGADGEYTITAAGAIAAAPSLPAFSIPEADVTGTLATTVLDDGGIWNSRRNGGNNAGIGVISDLGQGIFSAQGVMSSGTIPTPPLKTLGKALFQNDTQFLFLHYPAGTPLLFVPDLETNAGYAPLVGVLQAIAPKITVGQDSCDVLGLLALFCFATPGQIPPSFSGICTGLGA